MKQLSIFFSIILATSTTFIGCNSNTTTEQKSTAATNTTDNKMKAEQDLRAANDQLYAALNAMFTGDLAPMDSIWSHGSDVTDQGPFGSRLDGWDVVNAEFQKEAGMKLGGKVTCKSLVVHAGTDMGYTVCVEEGENMSADGKPVVVSHRATNVFRLENGKWKLVHHHTDLSPQLQEATAAKKK